jgi:hypothetical protein
MMALIINQNLQQLERIGVLACISTGIQLLVNATVKNDITCAQTDSHLLQPGTILTLPDGTSRLIADEGQTERPGLFTIPAPPVRYFCQLLRFDQTPADTFGRPEPVPVLITDSLPVVVVSDTFYTTTAVKQGDVIQFPDGDLYHVQSFRYENKHTIELSVKKQP